MARKESTILNELRSLCQSPGYAHAIVICWAQGNVVDFPNDELTAECLIKKPDILTRREIDILIGLAVQGDLDLDLPNPALVCKYVKKTVTLMEELHYTILETPRLPLSETPNNFGGALREPVIYGPESGYESQYLDFAVDRYSADHEWLKRKHRFIIEDVILVAKAILAVRDRRIESMLSNPPTNVTNEQNLLVSFFISLSDVVDESGLSVETVVAVLDAFSLSNKNEQFINASDFNAVTATPLIKISAGRYLLFQNYTLAEAIYTTPSYWMTDDPDYRDAHSVHRGRFAEKFCKGRLSDVFGSDCVFSNVNLLSGKQIVGEMDVLVLYGDRAIIVQVKSKRLTFEAKKGDLRKAKADFLKAIQHANDQGFKCASILSESDYVLEFKDGERSSLKIEFKEVYVVCVVSEPYPALTFQTYQFLNYEKTKCIQTPLVTDMFFIDVVAEMLSTPLRFLSYMNRRVNYHEKIIATDELAILNVHLRENLWIENDFDVLAILDQDTHELDVAMMARRAGIPGSDTPQGILTRVPPTVVGKIVAQLEAQPHPAAVEIGLMLLKFGWNMIEKIDTIIEEWQSQPNAEHIYGMSFPMPDLDAGLTIHINRLPLEKAEIHLSNTCLVRKYVSRAKTWFGILLDARDFITLRNARMISYPWEFDEKLAQAVNQYPAKKERMR